jgi:hypothetical protein
METYSVDLTKEQIERLANETDGFWGNAAEVGE